jgi:hypothetical protein
LMHETVADIAVLVSEINSWTFLFFPVLFPTASTVGSFLTVSHLGAVIAFQPLSLTSSPMSLFSIPRWMVLMLLK